MTHLHNVIHCIMMDYLLGEDIRQVVMKSPVFLPSPLQPCWLCGNPKASSHSDHLNSEYFDWSLPEEVHPENRFEVIGFVNEGEGYVKDISSMCKRQTVFQSPLPARTRTKLSEAN